MADIKANFGKKMLKAHLHVIFDDVVLNPLKPASDFALLKQN